MKMQRRKVEEKLRNGEYHGITWEALDVLRRVKGSQFVEIRIVESRFGFKIVDTYH